LRLGAHRSLIIDLLENGQIAEFAANLDSYEVSARALGSPRDIYSSMALRATQAILHGDLAAGEQLARGAALRGHELEQISGGAYFLQRFFVRYQQARLKEEMENLEPAGGTTSVFLSGASLAATAYAETGDADRAVSITRRILGPDGTDLPRDAFWLGGIALFAGVAATARDRDLMELVREMLEPCADHLVMFGAGGVVLGTGHHWLGILAAGCGDTDAALAHLDEATSIAKRIDAAYWLAQGNVEAATALRSRDRAGDRLRAERFITEAAQIADPRGYARTLGQIRALR
jgi:tetratricopeptide (TPR) repeat protein